MSPESRSGRGGRRRNEADESEQREREKGIKRGQEWVLEEKKERRGTN